VQFPAFAWERATRPWLLNHSSIHSSVDAVHVRDWPLLVVVLSLILCSDVISYDKVLLPFIIRLRAHNLKVEAAAWLEDGSCVCDQCPGEDEHVQNEVHALFICQDLWAEETLFLPVDTFFWGLFSSPTIFAATGQQPTCSWFPFSAEQ